MQVQVVDQWDDRNLFLGRITLSFSYELTNNVCLYRGPASRYEDESPPRNAGKQQKPAGGGYGYGDYDYLYKDASVCV